MRALSFFREHPQINRISPAIGASQLVQPPYIMAISTHKALRLPCTDLGVIHFANGCGNGPRWQSLNVYSKKGFGYSGVAIRLNQLLPWTPGSVRHDPAPGPTEDGRRGGGGLNGAEIESAFNSADIYSTNTRACSVQVVAWSMGRGHANYCACCEGREGRKDGRAEGGDNGRGGKEAGSGPKPKPRPRPLYPSGSSRRGGSRSSTA